MTMTQLVSSPIARASVGIKVFIVLWFLKGVVVEKRREPVPLVSEPTGTGSRHVLQSRSDA